ncbi:hypothetical protein GYO_1705 [Bacillus spizizenii TU-B-10]|uniref:Uncharacterized protein n=1 Tax=Bacillus spizizenii (strain DSM 15029 / JCM 12233 / NBRC 101239 / NRRL B-23049 / TU-B-10) TaxID=1052585 RepID=G4NVJ0_BACS4|nr:hypothetical protein GYO_1705 [Bacillus spizizenii TU-B-10]
MFCKSLAFSVLARETIHFHSLTISFCRKLSRYLALEHFL